MRNNITTLILLFSLFCSEAIFALSEKEIKTGFVYNFIKFINVPTANNDINLCIIKNGSSGYPFHQLNGKRIKEKVIKVSYVSSSSQLSQCDIAFLPSNSSQSIQAFASSGNRSKVVTISDKANFINAGGIIGLNTRGKKVLFEVNNSLAKKHGIFISSEMLSIASNVK